MLCIHGLNLEFFCCHVNLKFQSRILMNITMKKYYHLIKLHIKFRELSMTPQFCAKIIVSQNNSYLKRSVQISHSSITARPSPNDNDGSAGEVVSLVHHAAEQVPHESFWTQKGTFESSTVHFTVPGPAWEQELQGCGGESHAPVQKQNFLLVGPFKLSGKCCRTLL